MGLLQKAVETYDYFSHRVGIVDGQETPLAPISHIITAAQIEITLDQDGHFLSGRLVDKKEPKIIIPVTEESAGRTSSPCAHPLCDQLSYLADYDEKKHMLYVEQLSEWAEADPDNKKLNAILNYVRSGNILKDLSEEAVIKLDMYGKPEKEKMLVRWKVENGLEQSACWKDTELFQSFIRYYDAKRQNNEQNICMVSGKVDTIAIQHPKGIIPINGNAKLISANDSSGFTYRGRFDEDWQAATVSYTVSQKAHNALRWIAANQGIRVSMPGDEKHKLTDNIDNENYTVYGGRTFLCWNPQGKKVPAAPRALCRKNAKTAASFSDYKTQLIYTLSGYKNNLPDDAQAVIAAFDAATTGRMSVTYYNELLLSDFLNRLEYWDETCCWENGKFGIQSPSLYRIVQYAYGTPREGAIAPPGDGILRQQMQALIICRVDKSPIPENIERNLVQKASNLVLYDVNTRIQLLFITCAVIRKYYNDRFKEEIGMALDINNSDPSYLFGRLLAVAEKVESDTYSQNEVRETNAMRYQSVFVQRPFSTWRVLDEKLNPYYKKLLQNRNRPDSYNFYKRLTAEIVDKLPSDAKNLNRKLSDMYLIGYYHQRAELYRKKNTDAQKKNEDETNE